MRKDRYQKKKPAPHPGAATFATYTVHQQKVVVCWMERNLSRRGELRDRARLLRKLFAKIKKLSNAITLRDCLFVDRFRFGKHRDVVREFSGS